MHALTHITQIHSALKISSLTRTLILMLFTVSIDVRATLRFERWPECQHFLLFLFFLFLTLQPLFDSASSDSHTHIYTTATYTVSYIHTELLIHTIRKYTVTHKHMQYIYSVSYHTCMS